MLCIFAFLLENIPKLSFCINFIKGSILICNSSSKRIAKIVDYLPRNIVKYTYKEVMTMEYALKSKLKLLYLLQLLVHDSDEDHPLTTAEICTLLEEKGIIAERKSIYRDIEVLNRCGYKITKTTMPKRGYFLAKRNFELAEVRLLTDAVLTAPFISPGKTAQLVEKLCGTLSLYQQKQMHSQIHWEQRSKFANEEIYYTIATIHEAISQGKKVQFQYHHRVIKDKQAKWDAGRLFKISPYALLWSNDRYYLAGNYEKYNDLSNYRLDRMRHVLLLSEESRPFTEVSNYQEFFDVADYQRKAFHMFSGDPEEIELVCTGDMLDHILDKFGENVTFLYHDEDQFTIRTEVYISQGLVEWILQFGGRVRVLKPASLYEKTAEGIKALAAAYRL